MSLSMSEQTSRRYELLYIIPTTFTDEEVGGVETKVSALLTKLGATVESVTRLGKMRFAYPIQNQRHGHYVLVMLQAEPSMLAKIDENLRITNEVLRYMTLSAEEAGSDQKYELLPFTEVNLDAKEDRPRRAPAAEAPRPPEAKEGEAKPAEVPAAFVGEGVQPSKPAETV